MSWSWGYFAVFDQDGESSMDVMSCHVMMDIVEFQLPGHEQGGRISAYYVFNREIFYDEMKGIRAQGLRVHRDLQVQIHRSIWPLKKGSVSPILYG